MLVKSRDIWVDYGGYDHTGYNTELAEASICSATSGPTSLDTARAAHHWSMSNPTKFITPRIYAGNELFTSTENKRPMYNACVHDTTRLISHSYFVHYAGNDGICHSSIPYFGIKRTGNRVGFPPSASYLDTAYLLDRENGPYLDELANAQRNAWHAMQPRFEGQVALLNALFELKDFRSAIKSFISLGTARNIYRALRYGIPRSKSLDLSKPAAGLFLTNALAIQPLLKDVAAIMAQITTIVEEAQQKFDIAGESTQKSHYSYVLNEIDIVDRRYKSGHVDYILGKNDKLVFTATLEYTYEYRMRGLLRAFKQYWGLNLDFEALWNAVPFSFILDYFATLGKSLHNMEHDKNVNMAFTQYSESLLRTKFSGYSITRPTYEQAGLSTLLKAYVDTPGRNGLTSTGKFLSDSARIPISGYLGSTYRRRLAFPNKGTALPFFKAPSTHQGKVMVALARSFF